MKLFYLLVRLWLLVVNAAIFEQRVKRLQRHFRAVLGEADLVEDTDSSKFVNVALLLELLALPECRQDTAGSGKRAEKNVTVRGKIDIIKATYSIRDS